MLNNYEIFVKDIEEIIGENYDLIEGYSLDWIFEDEAEEAYDELA